jgi:hypothetical protein
VAVYVDCRCCLHPARKVIMHMQGKPNHAPPPNRRPRFPLEALARFDYLFCALPACPAAVGEAHR